MDMTKALSEIEAWPLEDQVEFVQQAWDRIVAAGWQPTLTEDLKTELDRRLAALDANPNDVISWESIEQYVRRQR